MEWTPGGVSGDIEDHRDDSGGGGFGGFGGGGGFGGIHLGCGGIILVGVLSLIFHKNFFSLLSNSSTVSTNAPVAQGVPDQGQDQREKPEVLFISSVLDDVQQTWDRTLPEQGGGVPYRHARLDLFRRAYPSACGTAKSAIGPFYCPEDEKVYLDLSFFDELKTRFGAPGEFAQAYVVAHELGHHVQKILGIEQKMHRLQQAEPEEANQLSVRVELEADCLAGVWGHSAEQRNKVHDDDVEAGLRAAAAVGDDRLQRMSTGQVNPESFTHGTSAQRTQWFRTGLESGRVAACLPLTRISSGSR